MLHFRLNRQANRLNIKLGGQIFHQFGDLSQTVLVQSIKNEFALAFSGNNASPAEDSKVL